MPEAWQQTAIAQTAAASSAIKAAEAQAWLKATMAETPTAVLDRTRERMKFLAEEYERGRFGIVGSTEAIARYGEVANTALGNVKDKAKDQFAELKSAIEGWGRDSAAAIVDFAITGKSSFSDMVNSMIADMARMVIQQNITGPLASTISGFFGPTVANADGGVYSSPSLSAYSGGIYNSPKFFAFANGAGVFGEAGPEAIMPLSRGPDGRLGVKAQGGGSTVNIEIINNSGAAVQQREVADHRGGRKMQIVIGEAVAGEMRRPGSAMHSAARQTFGLTPTLSGR